MRSNARLRVRLTAGEKRECEKKNESKKKHFHFDGLFIDFDAIESNLFISFFTIIHLLVYRVGQTRFFSIASTRIAGTLGPLFLRKSSISHLHEIYSPGKHVCLTSLHIIFIRVQIRIECTQKKRLYSQLYWR